MTCASALSTDRDTDRAFREVLERIIDSLGTDRADLAVAFVSPHHAAALGALAEQIIARGVARHIIGCTGEAIVGADREVESEPAVSLWATRLPAVTATPLRMSTDPGGMDGLEAALARGPSAGSVLIALGDPFTFPVDAWLRGLNEAAPAGLRIVGGMASAGQLPGQNALILDDRVYREGAVGVLLEGPLAVRTVVSQGCRPIGRPMIVTRAHENLIQELGRRPAFEVLKETYEALGPEDQQLVRRGLHVGRAISEYQDSFGRGDFLVRNVLGADESGAIAVTDRIRVGVTVQFHVRDAETADEDLRSLLAEIDDAERVTGALLFTCNGRGTRLFSRPDHDVATIRELVGPLPMAGFFAMGELGPVGGQNFVHGYTASLALFLEQD